jgi:tetratricopeptide (TPR) repeat protein
MLHHLLNRHTVGRFFFILLCFVFISVNRLSVPAQDNLKEADIRRNNERATDLLKNARSEAGKGRYDQALDLATRALDYSANKETAFFERAKIYTAKKDYDNAVKDFGECINLGEGKSLYYLARANAFSLMKKYPDAVTDLTEVIRLDPQSLQAYEARAEDNFLLQQYDEVINDMTDAIGLDRKPTHYRLRAAAFRELKDYENAILDYTHAVELNPKNPDIYVERGRTYLLMENYNEALADAKKAQYNDPASAEAKKLEAEAAKKSSEKAPGKPPEK